MNNFHSFEIESIAGRMRDTAAPTISDILELAFATAFFGGAFSFIGACVYIAFTI